MQTRNDIWLKNQLEQLWRKHFPDVELANEVVIKFGRSARTRLGSIRLSRNKKQSVILINGLFKDFFVPLKVIQAVIAHELTHYAQGFSSPLPKFAKYPHQGAIVTKEMKFRGLTDLVAFQKKWIKDHWPDFIDRRVPRRRTSIRRRRRPRYLRLFF